MAGVKTTSFKNGENFVLSLEITNLSDELILFTSLDTKDFMNVYRLNKLKPREQELIGKPYRHIFCTLQLGYLIQAKDKLKIQIAWVNREWTIGSPFYSGIFCSTADNDFLSPGQYVSEFSSGFSFVSGEVDYTTPVKHFEISFIIED